LTPDTIQAIIVLVPTHGPHSSPMTTFSLDHLASRFHGRAAWYSLALLALTGGVAGAVTSFFMKPVYRSSAAFQAEGGSGSPLPASLAGLASQLGNFSLGTNTVNAQFFADILTADAVLDRVIADTFPWEGGQATLTTVYGYQDLPPAMQREMSARRLRRSISSSVNTRTNVVRFAVEAGSPRLARDLAESIMQSLNEVNIILRQTRASAEQAFTTARAEEARRELTAAESQLTRFRERNRVMGSPALQTEESRLERAVEMAQTIYTQLRLQQEQAAVQAVRNTPAISVIDPPLEPVRRASPRRRVITLLGMLAGLCLGATWMVLNLNRGRTTA
jgi:uncharacterized protein involved in exopolysaccharide biosynthesis